MNIIRLNTTAPDGFVKVNVPQGGGGSAIEYYGIGNTLGKFAVVHVSSLARGNGIIVTPALMLFEYGYDAIDAIDAIAIDATLEIFGEGTKMTVGQLIAREGIDLSTLPRLTKEEFYTL